MAKSLDWINALEEEHTVKSMNSIIFEGVITTATTFSGEAEEKRCAYVLRSWRIETKAGEDDIQVLGDEVRVEFQSEELVEAARMYACMGRKVKVVGKIARSKLDGDIYILAGYVDYWPRLPGDEW
jgi:hypothetical protein